MKSPASTMLALGSAASTSLTNAFSTIACCVRCTSEERFGGWKRPSAVWSPPLELKWLATTMTVRPWKTNSPASGLRDDVQAGLVGSTRPGLRLRVAVPSAAVLTATASSDPPGVPGASETRSGL